MIFDAILTDGQKVPVDFQDLGRDAQRWCSQISWHGKSHLSRVSDTYTATERFKEDVQFMRSIGIIALYAGKSQIFDDRPSIWNWTRAA